MLQILFFDDNPFHSENKLFLERLRSSLKDRIADVLVERTINNVEVTLSTTRVDVLILDIMSEVPRNFLDAKGHRVSSALAGIEVLRRCRQGEYGRENSSATIFMRTTRAEGYIRRECLEAGASGFFSLGREDKKLIGKIIETCPERG